MTQHYFESPQARGERIYHEDYGLGKIIQMHDGTYNMHNGVTWDNAEVIDKHIGIDGIDPRSFITELLYFTREAEAQRMRAEKAEQELQQWRMELPRPEVYELACQARDRYKQRLDLANKEILRISEESTVWQCRALAAEESIGMFDSLFHSTHEELVVAQNKLNNLKKLLEDGFPDLDSLYHIIATDYPEGKNVDDNSD